MKSKVDYSLYLVTDSTEAILQGRDLVAVVEAALQGGVTIVQYRDKFSDTGKLIDTARALHAVTEKYNVPLIINDRVDVAAAVGAEGVHLGQDDMTIEHARAILGSDVIIGITVQSEQEAQTALEGGADYLGIGTVYATPTKQNTNRILGPAGVRGILASLPPSAAAVRTVCIGGMNASNVQRVLFQASHLTRALDGVAIVSAIMGSPQPKEAAERLRQLVRSPPPFAAAAEMKQQEITRGDIAAVLQRVAQKKPLNHNMTNLVVQNFAANIAIAGGSSPIMSNNGSEARDLAALGGALVVNMGTVTADGLSNYVRAIEAYNLCGGPIVYDPVGAGATSVRRAAVGHLMSLGYFSVIKGNQSEIQTVLGKQSNVVQHGVDSGSDGGLTDSEKAAIVKELATREKNVVLMTGKTDFISDGQRTYAVRNGHEYLGNITGSGCALGTTIAACLAVERNDKLLAAVAGLAIYEIAAEQAAARNDVHGPGTFVPAFIDEIYRIRTDTADNQLKWLDQLILNELRMT